jgi:hypothetical protein
MADVLPDEERLCLRMFERKYRDIDFEVDRDNELAITMPDNDEHDIVTYITRDEGKQLLDLLQRWLR